MNEWILKDTDEVYQPDKDDVAFVYVILFEDGEFYIGKKNLFTKRKVPFTKKQIESMTDKRKKKYKTVTKESNWKKYCSSSEKVIDKIEKGMEPKRYVVRSCKSLKESSFFENMYLYHYIPQDDCLNDNVSGAYFKEEIMEWTKNKYLQ